MLLSAMSAARGTIVASMMSARTRACGPVSARCQSPPFFPDEDSPRISQPSIMPLQKHSFACFRLFVAEEIEPAPMGAAEGTQYVLWIGC
ncbi:hypothetical protein C8Q69DRAFT_207332 [Paecilomyces variotii]|uniref:Uncharacterized protein n=1 Tax=Byssochlamys spectabilis TaxID=264951 RepID=A0A443HYE8_BYSSP|nr:hypothetical protein C8Q69DRAFT_207332 [Paecilomyces variotii]RWQ96859.1 hypothetical protein C8Q69DRAFT_207332 [Paecilomyces variotii]